MKLRSMLLAAVGLAALAAMPATPAAAQSYPSVNIRFGHSVSATSASSLADAWVAQEVAKRSNGKVKLQMFWAGAAGSPAELFDLISSGALDALLALRGLLQGGDTAIEIFEGRGHGLEVTP